MLRHAARVLALSLLPFACLNLGAQAVRVTRQGGQQAAAAAREARERPSTEKVNDLREQYRAVEETGGIMKGAKEMAFGKVFDGQNSAWLSEFKRMAEEAFPDATGFIACIGKKLRQAQRDEAREGEATKVKAATRYFATDEEKEAATAEAKKMWGDILAGQARCPTGIDLRLLKAATLKQGLNAVGHEDFLAKETMLAFDLDGTLHEMVHAHPEETGEELVKMAQAHKVVVTAAQAHNPNSCHVINASLAVQMHPPTSHEELIAALAPECAIVTGGLARETGAGMLRRWVDKLRSKVEAPCKCPENHYVKGKDAACRSRSKMNSFDPAEVYHAGCTCELDAMGLLGLNESQSDVCQRYDIYQAHAPMFAKPGIVMARYEKARGVLTYLQEKVAPDLATPKHIVFFDDWIGNSDSFAYYFCFTEKVPGLQRVSSVWHATSAALAKGKRDEAQYRAGKIPAIAPEDSYFSPDPYMDARLASFRAIYKEAAETHRSDNNTAGP